MEEKKSHVRVASMEIKDCKLMLCMKIFFLPPPKNYFSIYSLNIILKKASRSILQVGPITPSFMEEKKSRLYFAHP